MLEQRTQRTICPRCSYHRVTFWKELSADQKMLVERLEGSTVFDKAERKQHKFCERCWYEIAERQSDLA